MVEGDIETTKFFDRPALDVAAELAQRFYTSSKKAQEGKEGQAKPIQIMTPEGPKTYNITLAQVYNPSEAIKVWKGKRLQTIQAAHPGDVLAFKSRAGTLSFIKTTDGENVLLRAMKDAESGEEFKTATKVSELLELIHGGTGRLRLVTGNILRYDPANPITE